MVEPEFLNYYFNLSNRQELVIQSFLNGVLGERFLRTPSNYESSPSS